MPSIEGVYPAAVTPRRLGLQDINLGVMWDLLDFFSEHKVNGIVLLGSTGEFVHYSNAERMRMTGLAPKRSRVPILINVSHSTLDGAVELAQGAEGSGAAAVLLMPPYYFRYTQEAIRAFFIEFAAEAEINIPILLYNIPAFTSGVALETIEELLREGAIHGVKDSSGDWEEHVRLLELRKRQPFTLLIGNDRLIVGARQNGSCGCVSGVACAVPELVLALDRAVRAGAQEVVARLDLRVSQFMDWMDRLPVPIGIREAVAARGVKLGPHPAPLSQQQEHSANEFGLWFKDWLKIVQNECKHA
jgi:4-hydroxy-tetrahydrodipicolinate synthase